MMEGKTLRLTDDESSGHPATSRIDPDVETVTQMVRNYY
jgi:hypothetical protein